MAGKPFQRIAVNATQCDAKKMQYKATQCNVVQINPKYAQFIPLPHLSLEALQVYMDEDDMEDNVEVLARARPTSSPGRYASFQKN